MLKAGIYEQVLNGLISKEIDSSLHIVQTGPIDHEEAAKVALPSTSVTPGQDL